MTKNDKLKFHLSVGFLSNTVVSFLEQEYSNFVYMKGNDTISQLVKFLRRKFKLIEFKNFLRVYIHSIK